MIVVGVILVLIALVVLFTLQLISKHAASDKQLVFFRDKRTQAKLISETDEKIEFGVDVPYENKSRDEGRVAAGPGEPSGCAPYRRLL